MDIDKINEMWEKDAVIDDILLDQASLKIPQLHQKYLQILTNFRLLHKKASQELDKARFLKWMYYSGKADPKVYEDKPFPYKIMKSDVQNWVSVDEDIHKIELKIELYETTIKTLEEIIKQIHQMSYNIKNVIQWRTFTGGV
jgi:hypothetical protein